MTNIVLKMLGVGDKIDKAHEEKNVATCKIAELERERRRIERAISEMSKKVRQSEIIINDITKNIAVATGGTERGLKL